jgi:NAD(P)-dependent dehydrogenase (short-subunit alcohol dehydrogenase family)
LGEFLLSSAEGKERRAIITGADSTARVIAEAFLARGDRVAVCDVRDEAVAEFSRSNPSAFAMACNMGSEADVSYFMAEAIADLGGLDFLVNVVGMAGPTKPTEDVTPDEWKTTLDVNISGQFYAARAAIPHLKGQRFGGIVNFSTASTRTLLPNRSPYIVSKYAVEGLTRNLARELGSFNVRCNAVLPGGINNERVRLIQQRIADQKGISIEAVAEEGLQYVSMRTLIEMEEIADTVMFLCSDKAKHITGQLIGVCGNLEWES